MGINDDTHMIKAELGLASVYSENSSPGYIDKNMTPMNIKILTLTKDIIRRLGEVKTKDIFKQNSKEFHDEGLFSTVIFGEMGSKDRIERFGYIDLGIKVMHPRIYIELTSLSSLFKAVLEGKKYVRFDSKTKTLVETDKIDGDTGFKPFLDNWDKLEFETNDSIERLFKILFIKHAKKEDAFIDKLVVIPAGLRDYIETESGKVLENEINDYYRRVLSAAATAKNISKDTKESRFINLIRNKLQKSVVDVYKYLENLLDGKEKFIQGKWTKRSIAYGTRNVITGNPKEIKDLKDKSRPRSYSALVGIFQAAKGITPITMFNIKSKFISSVIDIESSNALLIDPKTLKRKIVTLKEKTRNVWITDEGLENILNKLIDDGFKNTPIELDGYYLYLVYDNDDKIEILNEINDNVDKKKVRPITYGELVYLSIFDIISDYPGYVTRYPVTGFGSTVPVIIYLKTTLKTTKKMVKLPNMIEYKEAPEYPIIGKKWFNSLSIPTIYLEGLGADFDGDKVSLNIVWTEEAKKEIRNLLFSKNFLINQNGKLVFSPETLNNKIMLQLMTE